MRWKPFGGVRTLPLLLAAALTSACATSPTGSSYRVQVPILTVRPLVVPCADRSGPHTCAVILLEDYQVLVREVKAACLANRQTPAECQAAPVAK